MDDGPPGYSASHAGGQRMLQQDRTLQLFPPIPKSRLALTARSSTVSSDSSRSARTDTSGSEASSMHSSRSAETGTSKHSSCSGVYSAVSHKGLHACTADGRGSTSKESSSLNGFGEDESVSEGRTCPTAPPPSRVLAGPGAHFIEWYIPKHIVGSRTLERTNKSRNKTSRSNTATKHRNQIIASPLHDTQKQKWLSQLVEPGVSSLSFPPAYKPPVITFPCTIADNLHQAFQNYRPQLAGNPSLYLGSPLYCPIPTPPDPSSLKSLLLHHGETYCSQGKDPIPLHGSIFTHCRAPRRLFTVHPEWRRRSDKGDSCNTL